jgi:1-acyl-sn-glycerol-3-phosphate acyltransferase
LPNPPRYPRVNRTIYRMGRAVFDLIYSIATRRHVTGLEHVPESGPYIMVSNHLSHVDPPLVYIELPAVVHVLAAEKYEHHPFRPILNIAGAIFINRGEVDRKALRRALAVLEGGEILGIAIEGTRSKTGGLIRGKSGPAYLATRANVPLLPVVVYGTEKAFHNLRRLRRTDVYTVIGPPIHLPEGRADSKQLDAFTDQIMVTLAAMLPEEYRGVYADHPLLKERLTSSTT